MDSIEMEFPVCLSVCLPAWHINWPVWNHYSSKGGGGGGGLGQHQRLSNVDRLTPSVFKERWLLLSAVGTHILDLYKPLDAYFTVHPSTVTVLPWFLHHQHAYEALERIRRLINEVEVQTTQGRCFGNHEIPDVTEKSFVLQAHMILLPLVS